MARPLRDLLLLGVVFLVSAAAIVHSRAEAPEVTEELRHRWDALTEGERERLRERYTEFEQLEPAEKQRLHRRASRLNDLARKLYRSLDDDERAQLDRLGVEKRRELLREMAVEQATQRGRRILALLPEGDRSRLLAATEDDRELFFMEFGKRQTRRLDEAIREHGPEVLDAAELEGLGRLSPDERREKFLEIYKRRVVRWVASHGRPEPLSERRWSAMTQMSPAEFRMAWDRLGDRYGIDGPQRRARPRGGMLRLTEAMQRGQEAERLALSGLEPLERRRQLLERQRERVLVTARELHAEGALDDAQLGSLVEAGDEDEFISRLRALASQLGRVRDERD